MAVSDHLAAPSDLGTVRADEEFWDLVCADDDWLRAEFDAIIAAGFTERARRLCPVHRAGHGPLPARQRGRRDTRRPADRAACGTRRPRERSPPPGRSRPAGRRTAVGHGAVREQRAAVP